MLLAIWLFLLAAIGAEDAIVREEGVALRKRAGAASETVRTLARGDRVRVLYSVTNDSGDWCEVAAGADTGYVQCAQLDWPGGKQRGAVVPPARPAPAPAKVQPPDVALRDQLMLHNYDPHFWAQRLRFDPDQRANLNQLLLASGVPQCAANFRAGILRYGIHDFRELAIASGQLENTPQGKAIVAQMDLCARRLITFWRRFPELLTPGQQTQWEAERRLVPPSTGLAESNLRLLFTQQ